MDRWSSPIGVEIRLWAYLCAAWPGSFFWLGVGFRVRLGFWLGFLRVIWLVVGLQWVGRRILIVGWFGRWMWELRRLNLDLLRLLEMVDGVWCCCRGGLGGVGVRDLRTWAANSARGWQGASTFGELIEIIGDGGIRRAGGWQECLLGGSGRLGCGELRCGRGLGVGLVAFC
jgi:hypothetical protein